MSLRTPLLMLSCPPVVAVVLAIVASSASADEPITRLSLEPTPTTLHGPWDRQQLLVTGHDARGRLRDLTHEVKWTSRNADIVAVTSFGVLAPRGAGQTVVQVRLGELTAQVLVLVEGMNPAAHVSFRRQVLPVLTQAGCNTGTCHASLGARTGFRLSLRGCDPEADHEALTRGSRARQLNLADPDASLFLRKGTGRMLHEGGAGLSRSDVRYAMLRQWIAEGATDDGHTAAPLRVSIFPGARILEEEITTQQLSVLAHFQDGTVRDVTHLARFRVSDETMLHVDPAGLVERKGKRGDAVVIAEYLGRLGTARLTLLDKVEDFTWPKPPERNYIDQHIFAKLHLLRIEPSGLCRDEAFLRRVCLDVLGRLPTPDEVRRFLADKTADKRDRLIDAMLERPEFADWWALKWADWLDCNQQTLGKAGVIKYHAWIRRALLANVSEDQLAFALLTSLGGNHENPPASYYRRLPEPQARAEETARLFLGVQLRCVRCHNHPDDSWTTDDYHGLVAFFAQLGYSSKGAGDKEEMLYLKRAGDWLHPRTGQPVRPKFPAGAMPRLDESEDRRAVLARWLTSPDNPYFARVSANRIWAQLFGRGLVEPIDDVRASNPASHEALLDLLAGDFARHGFDRKHLLRTILRSRVYQLDYIATKTNAEDEKYFSHVRLRRHQDDQARDVISDAAGVPDRFPGYPLGTRAVSLPDGEHRPRYLATISRPARETACECSRNPEVNLAAQLFLLGGNVFQEKLRDPNGRVPRLLAAGASDHAIIEELCLATVTRLPTPQELAVMLRHLNAKGTQTRRERVEDLLFALVNSKECLFRY